MPNVKLKDIVWGGRIRRAWQSKVWTVARKVATDTETRFSGNMVSSSERTYVRFLDGGVSDTRGFFDSSCGMQFHGEHSQAYVLYRLGLDARSLMRRRQVPSLTELEAALRKQRSRRR
jgi:hypothetical protein